MLTIYKASAGSGKTYTLTYEYIKTLLGIKESDGRYRLNSDKYTRGGRRRNRHGCILAITFTNAATEEMKSRIVKQLSILANPTPDERSPYTDALTGEFGCTADELREAAHKALSELLFDYGAFNVSTIDSFFQSVLRTFSREIDHQGDYELTIDRLDAVKQAIALMLDELNYQENGTNPRLYRWIEDFVSARIEKGGAPHFFDRNGTVINDFASSIDSAMDETFLRLADELDQYMTDGERLRKFRRRLRELASAATDGIDADASALIAEGDASGFAAYYNRSVLDRLVKLAAKPRDITDKFFDIKAFSDEPDDVELKNVLVAAAYKKTGEDAARRTARRIHAFGHKARLAYGRAKMYRELYESLDRLEFMCLVRKTLQSYMRDTNQVLIADTGELLKTIISDAEMPFIYERMGLKLTNLLIDEFQDTSRLQWHNLKPLVANSLAFDHDNLIIGDEKQAIYRFRNSDSELLGSQVQNIDFPKNHRLRGTDSSDNTNYRSAGDIVRFNNELFAAMAEEFGAVHYANVRQAIAPALDSLPAYIKLHFHDPKYGDERILEEMCTDILRQHDAGYAWRDILILTRTRGDARRTVEYIKAAHPEIELLSSDALLLSSSAAVRCIVSMLKLVSRSYEGKKATRSDSSDLYASRNDVEMMITRFFHYSGQGFDDREALERALEEGTGAGENITGQVDAIRSENAANLVALIEAIVAHRLSATQRREEYAYIAALEDLALKHMEGPDPSLAAFLSAYDRNSRKWAIKAPMAIDAVEVMTVHRSKGLERACIHIPFADWSINHRDTALWIEPGIFEEIDPDIVPPLLRIEASAKSPLSDPEISPLAQAIADDRLAEAIDNLNNTYVAFTRASRELIIHSSATRMGGAVARAMETVLSSGVLPFVTENRSDDLAEGVYHILGEPTSPTKKQKASEGVDAGEFTVNFRNDTRRLVSIDDILAADDDLGDEEAKEIIDSPAPFAGTPEMQEAGRRGTLLHSVLASMRTRADLDNSLARLCATMNIDDAERASFRAELEGAFADAAEMAAVWFDPDNRIYAERSLYDASTGTTSRPDRVVVRSDGSVNVVDYKFTAEARTSHRRQVADYKRLIGALGYTDVEAYLWYPLLRKIIKV